MKRPGPLIQMTLALVGLCGTLVLLADLFFGVLPDRDAQALRLRKGLSEALAVQVAALLQQDDRAALRRTLDDVVERTEGIRSLAIRRVDGTLWLQAGDHARHWQPLAGDASNAEQLTVPLHAGGARWGAFEIAYAAPPGSALGRFVRQPIVVTLLFLSFAGTLVFGLYMRRALQHLDPASVIPERVQGAFDAMAEGVVVLDARGRILLANKAFRAFAGDAAEAADAAMGRTLSSLAWWHGALPAEASAHPWARAMAEGVATSGHTLHVERAAQQASQIVVSCAPISDPGGDVRGCMVTLSDVSELHHANQALREAMAALHRSNDEVQRQNAELERLATRDPLTGCLNRRAFMRAFEAAWSDARRLGSPLGCVMIDIDHFKAVNDSHGHGVGDRVIQEVAKTLLEQARTTDLVCRYGGEEFCVVVPGLGPREAAAFAERLRAQIERACGPGVREVPGLAITASLGAGSLGAGVASAALLIDLADQALYRAKRSGRNRVCSAAADDSGCGEALLEPVGAGAAS